MVGAQTVGTFARTGRICAPHSKYSKFFEDGNIRTLVLGVSKGSTVCRLLARISSYASKVNELIYGTSLSRCRRFCPSYWTGTHNPNIWTVVIHSIIYCRMPKLGIASSAVKFPTGFRDMNWALGTPIVVYYLQ
jgi:hypothetical protein